MTDKADLVLGLFAGFVIGFLIGMYLTKAGILAPAAAAPSKQYGVKYEYSADGKLIAVLPVPIPG